DAVMPGMRVHVPVGTRYAIGVIVRIHDQAPAFETKPVRSVLDTEPVLSPELLALTEWVSRATYASWGETIQAALPVGLNFVSEKRIQAVTDAQVSLALADILLDVAEAGSMMLDEAERRWSPKTIAALLKAGALELFEQPKLQMGDVQEWVVDWAADGRTVLDSLLAEPPKRAAAWLSIASALPEIDLPMPMARLLVESGAKEHQIRRLIELEILESKRASVGQIPVDSTTYPERMHALNEEQHAAFEPILAAFDAPSEPFLLFGVTGSGKTEVYIKALHACVQRGKGGIVLVPEIALTPQTVNRFRRVFGDRIAVMHSRLTDRERYTTWMDLRSGRKSIVIGARSAVFAPVRDLGLLLIDEEHDASYKQEDPAPRYDAREVAIARAKACGAVVVMGSATPSLTTLHAVAKKQVRMLKLTKRHAAAVLPPVNVVDLRLYRKAMRGPLAVPVYLAIEEALAKGEQAIVLYNRRGYARFMQCESCGHTPECPNCSVTLTYHRAAETLRCHYCGHSERATRRCGSCGKPDIQEQGSGTQKVEEELQDLFPKARLLRMDRDTTSKRDSHARILTTFGSGGADILVGTQLVSKGLDFPNVTVVAVVQSDTELAFPSYKSAERMFQLLTQVAGRSGRADKPGVVHLQTYKPEHYALIHAAAHDFESFAREEMKVRKSLLWPPYSQLVTFEFKGKDAAKVMAVAQQFSIAVTQESGSWPVLGPAPSAIQKMLSEYRWELLVKTDPSLDVETRVDWLNRVFSTYLERRPEGGTAVRILVK
ncbi:MAG: hypothetical protein RL177_470, partial [Bacteroidota bacterium]